jgi:hypothetical protein
MRQFLILGSFLVITFAAIAQEKVYISGFVNDISSLQALGYVNISQQGKVVAATDQYGSFAVSVAKNDTIVFTRLGYQPIVYVARVSNWDERIFMTEMTKMLDEVIVQDRHIIHGDEEIKKSLREDAPSNFNNFTNDPQNQNRMIQTFGPSVSFGAPWEKWTADAREKKRLESVITEQEKTTVYQQFVHSMVVEQYIIGQFDLDHETYLKLKEGFIIANPDARYLHSRQDIIDLMVAYFASKK